MTTRVGKLLEEKTGVSAGTLGEKNLARAVRERMSACGLGEMELYYERVRTSARELEALIEAVVVPETSFFRDKGPFTYLGRYIHEEWTPALSAGPLRVLSAPCASGEEPYSIAIVLQEAGLMPGAYMINALDISRTLLRKAERATYTQHSFRGVPASLRDRYFVPVGRDYVLKDTAREGVRFSHGNLMDESILAGEQPYDIVFCRNLMIYLGAEARARLVRTIERLMARNGLVFVGHAETSCFPAAKFAPLDHRGAFGFRKVESGTTTISTGGRENLSAVVSTTDPADMALKTPQSVSPAPMQAAGPQERQDSLETARLLADQGRLPDAAEMCERLLVDDKANAGAYCLLGAVMHGLGNLRRAEECFVRAIYLDEHCYEAVVHLSLIKEHRGDLVGAEVLRRRAARIQPQTRIQ